MACSAKLYALCCVFALVRLARCETSGTPARDSRFLQAEPNGPYVKLTSGHCPPNLQVSKEDCLAAGKSVAGAEYAAYSWGAFLWQLIWGKKTELDGGRDSGKQGRPHGCTLHNGGNIEWWGHSDNAECGHWNYNCVCRREVGTTTTTTAFDLSRQEIVSVLGLSAAVHESNDIEEQHYHGFQEQLVVEDVHSSALLGDGVDHARVYTKNCTADYCEHCAIAFTATTDTWDFMQDLNISLTPFCGLQEVHAGFAQEMRAYMQQPNWADAMNFMRSERCGTAYAVGTSLGGSIASLFAFCANRAGDSGDDKTYFPGSFNIIPVTFGAAAIAKDEVYNGEPGQCFRGARVGIQQGIQQAQSLTLDSTSTLKSLNIISGLLHGLERPDERLDSSIVELQNNFTNALRNSIIESLLPDAIIALTDLIVTLVGHFMYGSGQLDLMTFVPLITPLDTLATLISNTSALAILSPFVNNQPMPAIGAKPDFKFEFDAVPALLSGFKFKHPKMSFHPIHHPEGVDPPVEEVVPCDVSDHLPEADFHHVLWATVASLAPFFGSGTFPNHHLCCYFRSLTGLPTGSCGTNPATGSAYKCAPPYWR